MRTLASIQRIEKIEPIEGADFIEKATVLGWHLVVRKDDGFRPGDLAVYFEIDSLLPDISQFAFLKSASGKMPQEGFVHRLKTKKLKGVISQGLLMPLSAFPNLRGFPGDDVTEEIGVKKYEPELHLPGIYAGQAEGRFPHFVHGTEETRIQNIPHVIYHLQGKPVYVTVKYDGTSATYYFKNGKFGVCSRTVERKRPVPEPVWRTKLVLWASKIGVLKFLRKYGILRHWEKGPPAGTVAKNPYWNVAVKLDLENKMRALGRNIAIQGELCGPAIQKNRLGLADFELFVFDVWDIDKQQYMSYSEQAAIANSLGLERVQDVGVFDFNWKSVDEILEFAKGKYPQYTWVEGRYSIIGTSKCNREGIVIRTMGDDRRFSFKAVNNDYLLKEEE